MRKIALIAALMFSASLLAQSVAQAQAPSTAMPAIKTRLDHLSDTKYVLVVSYLPAEITTITCQKWAMLGISSYKNQNNFTIPAGPSVAIMVTSGFDGYCKEHGSIVAHTDAGDFVGVLDRGDGNWTNSTKLTFTGATS